ncbi:MAG: hypothetical protein ACT4P6_17630 [Gemmatimonadaceae bacterium]
MKLNKAIVAGIVGGIAMTLLAWLARAAGMQLDGEMMLGTMLGNPPGAGTWLVGLGMHLMLSALIAILYAAGFEYVTHRAGAGPGFGFSLIHIVLAGLFMAMIPAVHPMVPEQMPAPGAFLVNMGAGHMALFIAEHLMYGGIVGALYGAVLHPRTRPAVA